MLVPLYPHIPKHAYAGNETWGHYRRARSYNTAKYHHYQYLCIGSDGQPLFAAAYTKSQFIQKHAKASKVLQCDLERIKNSPRVSETDKTKRDILLYLLWQDGTYTNMPIGGLLSITYSAVSRRVAIARKKMTLEASFEKQVNGKQTGQVYTLDKIFFIL